MPHKCVRCGNVFEDNDSSILRGCSCGSVFFLYVKSQNDVEQIKEMQKELETKETTLEQELTKQVEEKKKVEEAAIKQGKVKRGVINVKWGIETIKIPREGVYEINIDALMRKRPIVILERGRVYFIHLPSVFEKVRKID
jgi:hypothetical protein